MPVMDGFTATRRLRENAAWHSLPVIALTANAMAEDQERCFAAGMNAHVAKPIRMEVLYDRLLQCLPDYLPASTVPVISATSEATRSASDLPEFPGIDIALGLAHVGRLPLLLRVLKRFRDNQGQNFAPQFAEALAAADHEGMVRLAHSLKGVARTLGATDLGVAAAQLEIALESNSAQAIAQQFSLTTTQLDHVSAGLHQIDRLLDEATRPAQSPPLADLPDLSGLASLLKQRDTEALELASTLTPRLQASAHREAWAAVTQAIDRFDFVAADQALTSLQQRLAATVSSAQKENSK